jgi:hypothetical protein
MPTILTQRYSPPTAIAIPRFKRSAGSSLPAWLMLIGALLPEVAFRLDVGAKLTLGRICILLLLIPALIKLIGRNRCLMPSDLCACATGAWMLIAATQVGWDTSLSSTGAQCIEFVGGYFVARGFLFGTDAIDTFLRVLKIVATIAILLGFLDTLSGRLIVSETMAALSGNAVITHPDYRLDHVVRAASTFDQQILFGAFCAFAGIIFLYSERTVGSRLRWGLVCFLGCLSSLSSAPLLSFVIGLGVRVYDQLFRQFAWRWIALSSVVAAAIVVILLVTNHPVGWIISHLTFDPASGYFRLLIWDNALAKIADQPLTGYGFNLLQDDILDATVDCVWLVLALRFGVPMPALVMLTNIAAFLPGRMSRNVAGDAHVADLRSGFTLVLIMFALTGLTVHYWNYLWIFWGLCVGIRASLREQAVAARGA